MVVVRKKALCAVFLSSHLFAVLAEQWLDHAVVKGVLAEVEVEILVKELDKAPSERLAVLAEAVAKLAHDVLACLLSHTGHVALEHRPGLALEHLFDAHNEVDVLVYKVGLWTAADVRYKQN